MSDSSIPAPTPEARAKAHNPALVSPEPTAQAIQQGRLTGAQQAEAR